jgi:putative nucleotidyltransferase with HDIG domain
MSQATAQKLTMDLSSQNEFPNHFKVRINTMVAGKPTSFDLLLKLNNQLVIYLRAGDYLDKQKLEALKAKDNGSFFYVKEEDRRHYKTYVHEQMNSGDLGTKEKALVLRESSMTLIEEIFEQQDVNKVSENSRPLVTEFVQFIETEPDGMAYLINLSGHDFYTYNHSLDVAIYSLGLAQAMGFSKRDLEEMGMGALFHDVGKRHVHLDILCKKGPLDDAEWKQMQKHPQFGLQILNENTTISEAMKAACFEHHESWAGNGYPQQLIGSEIHPFARIVGITDCYDAMTTQRSYNVPMKPFDAVTLMKEKLAGRYDPDMLKAMHSVLFKLQPVKP